MRSQQQIDIEDDLIDDLFLTIILESLQRDGGKEAGNKRPQRRRDLNKNAGQQYLDQLLNCGHPERIKGALRMSRGTFISLHNWLVNHTQLRASMHVSVELKLAIFLHIVSRPASQRDTMERYFVGNRVVSESFHEVLDSLLILYPSFVKLPDLNTPLASRISDDPRFYPWFKDCLGALDGTHIAAHTSLEEQPKFRNRKGFLSQNVLAVCDFDLNFVYVLPGWEGSAHDGRVLLDAQASQGFVTPPGKYWLGDAGYGNSEYVLAPYRSVRYHLKEQRLANLKPENAKELFNLRHASLRNVIERIFGVIKRRFKILAVMGEYSIQTQIQLVLGLLGLFNFIRQREGVELNDDISDNAGDLTPLVAATRSQSQGSKAMNDFRDKVAQEMWVAYCQHIGREI